MKRVKKGESYLYIRINGDDFTIDVDTDYRAYGDLQRFKAGNYFTSVEAAQNVLEKIVKCFNGEPIISDLEFHKKLFDKYLKN